MKPRNHSIEVSATYEDLSERAAAAIFEVMRSAPRGLYCLAAGDTPRRAYRLLARRVLDEGLNVSEMRFVGLDEWIGLDGHDRGSCRALLNELLFGPLGIRMDRIAFFDAKSADLPGECRKIDEWIADWGPIDLVVLGIGMNGHLGFNEPGTRAETLSHAMDLEEVTQSVGTKYFDSGTAPAGGLTIGLGQIMGAKRALLMASGEGKAGIVRRAFSSDSFPEIPASILLRHPRFSLLLDAAAATGV